MKVTILSGKMLMHQRRTVFICSDVGRMKKKVKNHPVNPISPKKMTDRDGCGLGLAK